MTNETPITVYFESNAHAEIVARFSDEHVYLECLPALETIAQDERMIVTESCDNEEVNADIKSVLDVLEAARDCIHRHGLLSPMASDQDRRMVIERFSEWWNFQAMPCLEKFGVVE